MLARDNAFSLLTGLMQKGYLDRNCSLEIEEDIQLYLKEPEEEFNPEKNSSEGSKKPTIPEK